MWSDQALAELEEPKYEYNGLKMTEYEATQYQRKCERNIRRWKRECMAMEAGGQDTGKAAAKLKRWQREEKNFCEQTGLKQIKDRTMIAGFGRKEAAAATARTKAIDSIFSIAETVEEAEKYAKDVLSLPDATACRAINIDVANGVNKAISTVNDTFANLEPGYILDIVVKAEKDTEPYAEYDPRTKVLYLNRDATKKNAVELMKAETAGNYDAGFWSSNDPFHSVYHELGHAVQHSILDNDQQKRKSVQELYFEAYCDILGADAEHLGTNVDDPRFFEEAKKAKEAGFSYYGLKSLGEFTAESIAQYLSGEPGKIAKRVLSALLGE